ncbi:MAG: GGDEF domain-containing protein [Halothiobacillaceae bacterium]|nr:MAG: GGDEF domain-containing protein [Halothiobacillaceae bacterium]
MSPSPPPPSAPMIRETVVRYLLAGAGFVLLFAGVGWQDWVNFQQRRLALAESTALHGTGMAVAEMQEHARQGELLRRSSPNLAEGLLRQDDQPLAEARLDLLLSEWFPHYLDYSVFPAEDCALRLPAMQAALCAPATPAVSLLLDEPGGSIDLLLRLEDASGAPYMLRVRQEPRRLEEVQRAFSLNGQQAVLYRRGEHVAGHDMLATVDIPDTPWRLGVRTDPAVMVQQQAYIATRVGGALLLVLAGMLSMFWLRLRTEHLRARGSALEASNQRLFEQATHDALTGLHNRHAFSEHYQRLIRHVQRDRLPFALLLVDADHFKQVNDTWGHEAGDEVLKRVAEVIAHGARRPLDMAARLGGEEFVVLLEGVQGEDAWAWGELLRLRLADLRLPHPSGRYVSVSIGVASTGGGQAPALKDLLARADRALYEAKGAGRDRVIGEWEVDT